MIFSIKSFTKRGCIFLLLVGLALLVSIVTKAQISGRTSVCPGTTYSYSSSSLAASYSWGVTGGTIISGRFSRTVKVQWNRGAGQLLLSTTTTAGYEAEHSLDVYASTGSGGVISGGGSYCSPATGTLTLSGNSGAVLRWEFSTDGGSTWASISNTNTWHYYSDITQPTQFRAVVSNNCGGIYSAVATVALKGAPPAAPTVTNASVCVGERATLTASGTGVSYKWYIKTPDGFWPAPGDNTSSTYITPTHVAAENTYIYVKTFSAEGCASPAAMATTTALPQPDAPAVPAPGDFAYTCESTTVTVTAASPGYTKYWQTTADGTSTTNASEKYTAATSQVVYLRNRNNSTGCWSPATSVDIKVFTRPAVPNAPTVKQECGKAILTAAVDPSLDYFWQTKADGISTTTSGSYIVTTSGTYYLRTKVKGIDCWSPATAVTVTVAPVLSCLEGQNMNFVVTNTIQKEGVKTEAEISSLLAEDNAQTVAYFDGFGRGIQQVSVQGSPEKNDIVQMIDYDAAGRVNINYLPYTAPVGGRYTTDPLSALKAFYSATGTDCASTTTPWAETVFEESPLNRVLEQGAPGEAWQIGTGKTVKIKTRPNEADEVRLWNYDFVQGASSTGYYPAGELLVTETTDEDGNTTWQYNDKQGKEVLVKRQADAAEVAETYYVYDAFGHLRLVMQPAGVKLLSSNNWIVNTEFISQWCFAYGYDNLGRLVEKRIPGADPIYYVYNKRDQQILSQDGVQRKKGEWSFTKYDALRRPIMTGLHADTRSFNEMQAAANGVEMQFEKRTAENYATQYGYTVSQSFPPLTPTSQILTVNYYDDYESHAKPGDPLPRYESSGMSEEPVQSNRTTNLVTGSMVRVLGTDDMLLITLFYDEDKRLIQSQKQNHLGGSDVVTNRYDINRQLVETRHSHTVAGTAPLVVKKLYSYDHNGRQDTLWQQINDDDTVVLAVYNYNDQGQLSEKKLHSTDGTNFLQTVNMCYNERGWLTKINDAELQEDPSDLFGMELRYEEGAVSRPGVKYFNGNIAEMRYSVAQIPNQYDPNPNKAYVFDYDKLSRLADAFYATKSATGWDAQLGAFDEAGITYDLNGNIKTLNRNVLYKGETTIKPLDILRYQYKGNQLIKVEDLSGNTDGFKDGFPIK